MKLLVGVAKLTALATTYWLTEDIGEDEQEDGAQKVDHADGNVERVGLLVHVWAKHADSDQHAPIGPYYGLIMQEGAQQSRRRAFQTNN